MHACVKRCALFVCSLMAACAAHTRGPALDDYVTQRMARLHVQGLAIAVIDNGKVTRIGTWGKRNDKGDPLTPDTVMYGASLTKMPWSWEYGDVSWARP